MGIYIQVSDDLMAQRREQELLLLMAIARHADRLGFCFPGRARLMAMRRCSQPVYERRLAFLEECGYVQMTETWDYRRRQPQFDFQLSPRAIYIREEFQPYCEAVFDGIQERDFAVEKALLENHFSTNDSLEKTTQENHFSTNDSQPEVVTRIRNQTQEPDTETRRKTSVHNQRSNRAEKQQGRNTSTMRNDAQRQTASTTQPTATDAKRTEKDNPQAGGPAPDLDNLILDKELLIKAVMHVASTTEHQARAAVETYPVDQIMHWLRHTNQRRQKGKLTKPGGYFFRMLGLYGLPSDPAMPNGQTYEQWENDQNSDQQEL